MKREYSIETYSRRLVITDSLKQFNKIRLSVGLCKQSKEQPCCLMCKGFHYMFIPKGSCLSAAVHEAVHVAIDLLDDIGFKLDPDNQEPIAWLTDHIFRKYLEFSKR